MKTLNKKLIEELRKGDTVLEHTGSVDELTEILSATFFNGNGGFVTNGDCKFYKKCDYCIFIGTDNTPNVPTHPTSDFFIEEEQSADIEEPLKWGEPVMVRDSENGKWYGGYIYVGKNPKTGAKGSHVVVTKIDGLPAHWKYCKRKPLKFTRAEYAQKLGISIDQISAIELID